MLGLTDDTFACSISARIKAELHLKFLIVRIVFSSLKVFVILVLNVIMLQQKHASWSSTIKANMKVFVYPCTECDYAATTPSHSKQHTRSKHESIRYPWIECNNAATESGHLKQHKEINHKGIRYPCSECNYAATIVWSLKLHKKRKHEILVFIVR